MQSAETQTERVVAFITGQQPAEVSALAMEIATQAITDCLGVMIAGCRTDVGRRIVNYVLALGGDPSAPIVGHGGRAPAPLAALANGTLAHALDFDDDEPILFSGHPSAPLMAALVPLAHTRGVSGARFIDAFLVGFEIQSRLGRAVNPGHYRVGWHPTSTLGVLGATAACARLLNLDATCTARALGIAGSSVAGLKQNFGSMTKSLHVGRAGEAAVIAVELAESGFTADEHILDGPLGVINLLGSEQHVNSASGVFDDLGTRHAILDPGLAIKQYPCCSCTHPALDVVLALRAEHRLEPEHVVAVECRVAPGTEDILNHPVPATGLEGKFSMQYCVATAIVHGEVTVDSFGDRAFADRRVHALRRKISMIIDPAYARPGVTASTSTQVNVTLEDGRRLERLARYPKGSPQDPVGWAEINTKFIGCTAGIVPDAVSRSLLDRLRVLERQPQMSALLDMCANGTYAASDDRGGTERDACGA